MGRSAYGNSASTGLDSALIGFVACRKLSHTDCLKNAGYSGFSRFNAASICFSFLSARASSPYYMVRTAAGTADRSSAHLGPSNFRNSFRQQGRFCNTRPRTDRTGTSCMSLGRFAAHAITIAALNRNNVLQLHTLLVLGATEYICICCKTKS